MTSSPWVRIGTVWIGGGLLANFAWEMLQMPRNAPDASPERGMDSRLADDRDSAGARLAEPFPERERRATAKRWSNSSCSARQCSPARGRPGSTSAKCLPWRGVFTLNPILAREACKLHEATPRRLLARIVPRFLKDVPPEVSREALLHTWQSFNGTLRNIVLTKPIAVPLARIGPKVTFVHGRADPITTLERVQILAKATGARELVTEDDHLSYPLRSARRVIAAMEAR